MPLAPPGDSYQKTEKLISVLFAAGALMSSCSYRPEAHDPSRAPISEICIHDMIILPKSQEDVLRNMNQMRLHHTLLADKSAKPCVQSWLAVDKSVILEPAFAEVLHIEDFFGKEDIFGYENGLSNGLFRIQVLNNNEKISYTLELNLKNSTIDFTEVARIFGSDWVDNLQSFVHPPAATTDPHGNANIKYRSEGEAYASTIEMRFDPHGFLWILSVKTVEK